MNKNIYNNFIKSCNNCILASEKSLNSCSYYPNKHSLKTEEDCAASYQNLIDNCKKCIHEANLLLENQFIEENIADKAKSACRETIDRCQESINQILNKDKDGKIWALDQIDKLIVTCDEIIEKLSKN